MSLYGPLALLWAIPLVGVILALYLLKMRRRDVLVPAKFLWPDKVEEIRANSLFQKLRFSVLLLLQILAALCAALALGRPQILQKGMTGQSSVIVIDSSLTMGATDVLPSRLEYAKRKARDIVNAEAPGEKVAIIDAGSAPRVLSPLAHDPNAQLRAIDQIRQSDGPSSVGEALRIAISLVGSNAAGRLVLLSDATFGSVANFNPGKASFAFESVGASQEDLAISALGVTDSPAGRLVYCAVKNLGVFPHPAAITVLADGAVAHSERITVPAGRTWSATFTAPSDAAAFEGKLDSEDILAADNYAAVTAQKGSKLNVLLLTPEDPFTERALALDPRVALDRGSQLPDSERSRATCKYDVVVFDGVPEEPVGSPGVLVLGSTSADDWASSAGTSTDATFVNQSPDSLLSYVNLSEVRPTKSQKLKALRAETLATTSQGPEVLAVRGPQRRIYLSFQPLDSNFPLLPAFPIFLANCLDFMAQSKDTGPIVVHPGAPFAVTAEGAGSLSGPNGFKADVSPKSGLLALPALEAVGRYVLTVDGKSRSIYSSLSEPPKTVSPAHKLSIGSSQVATSASALSTVDVWRYFALALLGLLVAEWLIFARRS